MALQHVHTGFRGVANEFQRQQEFLFTQSAELEAVKEQTAAEINRHIVTLNALTGGLTEVTSWANKQRAEFQACQQEVQRLRSDLQDL